MRGLRSPRRCAYGAEAMERRLLLSSAAELVADVNTSPGSGGSGAYDIEPLGDGSTVLLSADDAFVGRELWLTNGTAAGTRLLRDILPGPQSSGPAELTRVNSLVFFAASDGINGTELWRTDGTEAGTFLVHDVAPGTAGSSPSRLTAVGDLLFFVAEHPVHGRSLWRSDGSSEGTFFLRTLSPYWWQFPPREEFVDLNGTLMFTLNSIFITDPELWKSDGTVQGTVRVRDINPGDAGSTPSGLVSAGDTLYFAAYERQPARSCGAATGRSRALNSCVTSTPARRTEEPIRWRPVRTGPCISARPTAFMAASCGNRTARPPGQSSCATFVPVDRVRIRCA